MSAIATLDDFNSPVKFHTYRSDAEWHALRALCITSTDAPALFDLSPYTTRYELYHAKRDKVVTEITDNERMRAGRFLEPAIGAMISDQMGWEVKPFKQFVTRTDAPIGASYDFFARSDEAPGPGVLEIKNVDSLVYRDQWTEDEAPPHIELQLQHQMETAQYDWGCIAALVGGNRIVTYLRERDTQVGAGIINEARKLYAEIAAGVEPTPDFARDYETIARLYGHAEANKVVLSSDARLVELAERYRAAAIAIAEAKAAQEAAKAEMLTLVGDAEKVLLPGYSVTLSMVAGSRVEAFDRKGYRLFRVTERKTKS